VYELLSKLLLALMLATVIGVCGGADPFGFRSGAATVECTTDATLPYR
jgi:hypothetical protein